MKVMISIPMNGRNDEDIKRDMNKYKEEFAKLHIDVINSVFAEVVTKDYNMPALFYLGCSIDLIGQVDAVFFADGWQMARGCRIERKVCEEYGVKILDEDFLFPPVIENSRELPKRPISYREIAKHNSKLFEDAIAEFNESHKQNLKNEIDKTNCMISEEDYIEKSKGKNIIASNYPNNFKRM